MKTSSWTQPPSVTGRPARLFRRLPAALAAVAAFALAPLAGATPYTWNVTSGNWSAPGSWSPGSSVSGPAAADTAIFGSNDASTNSPAVNNIVDPGFTNAIAGLTYNSVYSSVNSPGSPIYDVTQIPSGQTLLVTGPVLVGGLNEGAGGYLTFANMTGGGVFEATGPTFTVQNYGSASGANAAAYLNLTNLSYFVYDNATGTVSIADNPGSLTRLGGNLYLAGVSNLIVATNLNLATSTSAQAGPLSTLTLGAGTNVIYVNNLNIANNKNSGTVSFAAPSGGLYLRGLAGTAASRSSIIIGNRSVNGGTGTTTGTVLFDGSAINIKASTFVLGDNSGATSGTFGIGVFQFDTGTLDATTVILGNAPAGTATGTLSVGTNGTLVVGAGGLLLASAGSGATATGTLDLTNGTVVCNGSVTTTNAGGTATSAINFVTGGHLILGSGSYVGTAAAPIGNLNLDTNSILEFGIPSTTQTNIEVNALTWPVNDSELTITIDGLPVGIAVGTMIPLIQFNSMAGGAYTAPVLHLPAGVTGNLSLSGNTIYLTVTGGVGPGVGGINQLANPSFEQTPLNTGWTSTGNAPVITIGPTTTYYNQGACPSDPTAEQVVSHSGTNVANIFGQFLATGSSSSWSQEVPTIAGSTFTAGAYTYVSHEDLMSGKNSFYYEVDFLDGNGNLLSSYESLVVSNLTCSETTPFTVDAWNYLAVTNQMQVTRGTNTGAVTGGIATGVVTAPPQTAQVRFSAIFLQQGPPDNYDGGSVYLDDANLGLVSGPIPPTLSSVSPNLITLCTNSAVTCTASSTVTTISSVQVIITTNALGGSSTTVTNTIGSPNLTVTGLNTATASISYALATNTIYSSLVVQAIDANGVTVSSSPLTLDTIEPSLVIEAADFNFSGGQFFDTPANGGLALYTNQVGVAGIDENKQTRTATQGYYRPGDAVIIQGAAPNTGNPPSGTEQKFVTALANGDTNDIEVEVGYNTPGDWLNYTRTYGPGGSAPAGIYNVWCYLATSGSGVQATLSMVTSNPTQSGQTTNFLGYIGTSAFTDASYNTFKYVPLVDQYGNLVTVALTNQVTLKSTVVGNPNLGFYLLMPVQPVLSPTLLHVSPSGGAPFEDTNSFTFTLGPADGAPLNTNGISLTMNGANVTSDLVFSQSGGNWIATYTVQSNMTYVAVISATNTAGLGSSYTVNFDTFDPNSYQWECVDYDFSTNNGSAWVSGLYIDNPVPSGDTTSPNTGNFATNSYFGYPTDFTPGNDTLVGLGAVAQQGIDINFPDTQTGANAAYRADGVGAQAATDYLRPKFVAARTEFGDATICPFNIGYFDAGNWMNYTRDYPTNNYNVWARLAGGAGAFSGTTLSLVTSGVGTSSQTTQVLGSFADANPAGWQAYHWIPLLDTNGNQVVVSLGGKATLRLTSGNNLNAEFLMLTPAVAPASGFTIAAAPVAGHINISIPTQSGYNYTLYYTPSLAPASWSSVGSAIAGDGTVHVVSEPASGAQGYYQVVAH